MWREGVWEDIMDVPTIPTLSYPHVPHNRSVLLIALAMADVFKKIHNIDVNRDYLISAALLQDSCKLVEYQKTNDGYSRTELGETFTHGFYAAHVAMDVGLPNEIVQAILMHTPDSPTYPPNLLTKILFYADQADMAALKGDRWKKVCVTYR